MRFLLALSLSLAAAAAPAQQVYKWKDANGITHYGDKPMRNDATVADLPALQIYGLSNGKKVTRSGAPYGGNGPHVEITQPAADSTLLPGKFTVNVTAAPELVTGQSFNYYLDGALQNRTPTSSTAFLYAGAGNGDHLISVAVVDDTGRELSRSEPVIVHLQVASPATPAASPAPAPAPALKPVAPQLPPGLKQGG